MNRCKLIITSLALCITLVFVTGCSLLLPSGGESPSMGGSGSSGGTVHPSVVGVPDRLTTEAEKIARFSDGDMSSLHVSNGYANANPFDCYWSSSNVRLDSGRLLMSLTEGVNYDRGRQYDYVGAECRSREWYSYGFYSVYMKAADCSGVISSFFTYTSNPWDEIDIEFLGKDMTSVQFNYYTKGVGNHEYVYKLGFDASKDFHEYAFEWLPNSITWYVDGKAVYRATDNIPTTTTQIMMNVWKCKDHDNWSGKFDPTSIPVTAEYKWIGYSAA